MNTHGVHDVDVDLSTRDDSMDFGDSDAGEKGYMDAVRNRMSMICRFLPDGELTFVNRALCARLGMRKGDLVGRKFYDFLEARDVDSVRRAIESLGPDRRFVVTVERVILQDGSMRWFSWVNRVFLGKDGRIKYYQAVGNDITDLKTALAAVNEIERHFRGLILNVQGFAVYRLEFRPEDAGRLSVMFVSPSIAEILYPGNSLDPSSWLDNVHPGDAEKLIEAGKRFFKTGIFDEVFRVIPPGSQENDQRWVRMRSEKLPTRQRGNVWYINGLAMDITSQKRNEIAQEEMEQKFLKLLDTMVDGFIILDKNEKIIFINKSTSNHFKMKEDELLGEKFDKFFGEGNRCLPAANGEKARKSHAERYELNLVRADGSVFPALVALRRLHDSGGEVLGCLMLITDISRLKKVEQKLLAREHDLDRKNKELEKSNIALEVLLESVNRRQKKMEEQMISVAETLIFPSLQRLKSSGLSGRQAQEIELVEKNFSDLFSPFSERFSRLLHLLTATEVQVASLLKHGCSSKEIADHLCVAVRTVDTHRRNIRKKLGLNGTRTSLRKYLLTLQE